MPSTTPLIHSPHESPQQLLARALSVWNEQLYFACGFALSKGVAKGRLEYEGYGETRPIGDNKTQEGRQKNRRVEFHVIP